MKVKLTSLYRTLNVGGLRTTSVVGECDSLPKTGEAFVMFAEPLESGNLRCVSTSKAVDVKIEESIITFVTESGSLYSVEILEV